MDDGGVETVLPQGLRTGEQLHPLKTKKVIVKGSAGTGKTEFIMQTAIKLLLPCKDWFGVQFGGLECHVMWIDADMKFSIDRFSFLLKRVVENKIRETELHHRDDLSFLDSLARSITFESLSNLLDACLSRLHFAVPADHMELRILLSSFPGSLDKLADSSASWALVIDTIDAFFRLERLELTKSASHQDSRSRTTAVEDLVTHLVAHSAFTLAVCTASSKFQATSGSTIEFDSTGRKLSYHGRQYRVAITQDEGLICTLSG